MLTDIALSHADTAGTKAQVIAQNAVIDRACGVWPSLPQSTPIEAGPGR